MKVDVYTTLRNEHEILPYFFRHYEQFASRIFVYDDDSDDGSREIIKASPKAILMEPLTKGLDDTYFANLHSNAYKVLSRDEADWVMCVDADEFIYHRDMLTELQGIKDLGYELVECSGFQMMSSTFPTNGGQIYHEVNKGFADGRYTKWVVFQPHIDLTFQVGRHGTNSNAKRMRGSALKLLHFRYLSEEYVRAKHAKNWSRMSQANIGAGLGGHNNPTYGGEYDLKWYKQRIGDAKPCLD